MNIHEAVTDLKKMFEAKPVFKAAGKDDLARRQAPAEAAKQKALAAGQVWCDECMAVPSVLLVEFDIANQEVRLKADGQSIDSLGAVNVQEPNHIACGDCYNSELHNAEKIRSQLVG